LINCAELSTDESLLIVCESPALGWYDDAVFEAIASAARELGVVPTMFDVGAPENERDPNLITAMDNHDCTIFLARIGDQDRFAAPVPGKKTVMSYARTADELASSYGRGNHRAFVELKLAINNILLNAETIHVTCPLGTSISGSASDSEWESLGEVSVRRFPLGVPLPLAASKMSGTVALARYLTPTGSKTYDPPSVPIDGVVMAEVSQGRIVDFTGAPLAVECVRRHYRMVADKFGIDENIVHSFHAGIHPGSSYTKAAAEDPDRWSNSIFTNPRILHFHTCGDYAPGEICWVLVDHTLSADSVKLWDNGRLCLDAFEKTRYCLEAWPELDAMAASPSQAIGIN